MRLGVPFDGDVRGRQGRAGHLVANPDDVADLNGTEANGLMAEVVHDGPRGERFTRTPAAATA